MAFLDNSGDIILDAVLTDLGRKRMSEGNFRITQFALGDDEVDYSLYNKNHPSGSAYYDLEILQTPVFEAFTRTNANINYGLASYNGNQNLLYLPSIKLNTKKLKSQNAQYFPSSGGVVYFTVDAAAGTEPTVQAGVGGSVTILNQNANFLLFETGLDTIRGELIASSDTRGSYIVANSLVDTQFIVSVNTKVFNGVYTSNGAIDGFSVNRPIDADIKTNAGTFSGRSPLISINSGQGQLDDYKFALITAHPNTLYANSTTGGSVPQDTDVSVINGPRAAIGALTFELATNLSSGSGAAEYARLGKENQDLFSDGNLYDYIDTMVYITGNVTGVTLQVPIRVIRKV